MSGMRTVITVNPLLFETDFRVAGTANSDRQFANDDVRCWNPSSTLVRLATAWPTQTEVTVVDPTTQDILTGSPDKMTRPVASVCTAGVSEVVKSNPAKLRAAERVVKTLVWLADCVTISSEVCQEANRLSWDASQAAS
jgi:hypothetical protein